MKKWQVLAAALLFALAGGLKLLQHRRAAGQRELPPVHVLPGGQLLPEDTTQYYIPEEFLAVPPKSGAPDTYGALPTIKNEIYGRGPCPGGSLNEILSSHGRTWGYEARHAAFRGEESLEVYGLLERYLACVALSRRSPGYCDYLPGQSRGGDLKIGRFESPNYKCRENYMNVSFPAYAAGREKSEAACRMLLSGQSMTEGKQVSGQDFCAAAAKGMENICGSFSSSLDGDLMGECRRFLPSSRADCGSDRTCLDRLAIYGAMKSGNAASCPADYRGLCGAFLAEKEGACSVILVRLETVYCDYLAKANKKAHGYAGYSPEEAKEAIRLEAEARADKERNETEARRLTEEVNRRARQMLGKQGAEPK